jgi:hypothetical protein
MNEIVKLEEVRRFFETYAKLFDEGKWEEFCELFHCPALSVRGDGSVSVLGSKTEAALFFKGVAEAWKSEGYTHFTITEMSVLCLGSQSLLATFTWHMRSSGGEEIKAWRQSYQLVKASERWLVLSSTFHIEKK